MKYFPPQGTKANWGCPQNHLNGQSRVALYKRWYLHVLHRGGRYAAMIWQHDANNKTDKRPAPDTFKTEALAVKWCENTVDQICRSVSTCDTQQLVHQARWAIDQLIAFGCTEGLEILIEHLKEHVPEPVNS